MKKNAIIYIDDTHAQVTKAFEKQARIFGTPEYREWRAYRQDFPSAQMVTKTIKKNTSKRTYKNLTYANMERFLNMQANGKELIKEFNDQKAIAAIQQNPYRAVLAWFLTKFPKYDEYRSSLLTTVRRWSLPPGMTTTSKPFPISNIEVHISKRREFDTMEFTRTRMIGYLLLFCTTGGEYHKERERLTSLTDEALKAEFIDQYNSLRGAHPDHPLYEGNTPDLYLDF